MSQDDDTINLMYTMVVRTRTHFHSPTCSTINCFFVYELMPVRFVCFSLSLAFSLSLVLFFAHHSRWQFLILSWSRFWHFWSHYLYAVCVATTNRIQFCVRMYIFSLSLNSRKHSKSLKCLIYRTRAHIFSYLELNLDTNVGIKWDNAYDDWKETKLATTNGGGGDTYR